MKFNYPIRFKWGYGGEVVEFTALSTGTTIESGEGSHPIGYHSTTFTQHTNKDWAPVAMPNTTKRKLHGMVQQYK